MAESSPPPPLSEVQRAALLADPDVRQVLPRVEFSGLISNGDKSTVMMATGIDPDSEFAVKGPFLRITEGEVTVNAEVVRSPSRRVRVGDVVVLRALLNTPMLTDDATLLLENGFE